MDNQHDHCDNSLPPEDLDALLEGLQKGTPPLLPRDQRGEEEFLGKLVSSARGVRLDEGYTSRLEKHLRRMPTAAGTPAPGRKPEEVPAGRARQPWRRVRRVRHMAVAFSGVALAAMLGLSSLVGSHLPPAGATPPLLDWATNGLYAASVTTTATTATTAQESTLTAGAIVSPRSRPSRQGELGTPETVLAVQAPAPPHTPLPDRRPSDTVNAVPLGH